jgi:hypothetical protein
MSPVKYELGFDTPKEVLFIVAPPVTFPSSPVLAVYCSHDVACD